MSAWHMNLSVEQRVCPAYARTSMRLTCACATAKKSRNLLLFATTQNISYMCNLPSVHQGRDQKSITKDVCVLLKRQICVSLEFEIGMPTTTRHIFAYVLRAMDQFRYSSWRWSIPSMYNCILYPYVVLFYLYYHIERFFLCARVFSVSLLCVRARKRIF